MSNGVGLRAMKSSLPVGLLILLAFDTADATVCGTYIRLVNSSSSEVVVEIRSYETYAQKAPAPPKDFFDDYSPNSRGEETYFSRSWKITVPTGTDDSASFKIGCGARVWLNWRTLGADQAHSASGQIELTEKEAMIRVR